MLHTSASVFGAGPRPADEIDDQKCDCASLEELGVNE